MSFLSQVETPAVIIDLDQVEKNITQFQGHCDQHGIALRPHIKTHKLPILAKKQIAAGAIGITCQKISEAEVMVDAGIEDILITYNILGNSKIKRLVQLSQRCRLSVVADNQTVIEGLSLAFSKQPQSLEVLIECDTGASRCGVQSINEVLKLAQLIHSSKGLQLGGLMTYPPMGDQSLVEHWLRSAKNTLNENHLPCPRVSSGGTPNMWRAQEVPTATEHRAGTYIYNDRSLIKAGICSIEGCALTVLATIVSKPTSQRAIIDAGSKILTSDTLGLEGHGITSVSPIVKVSSLHEEHGILELPQQDMAFEIGDRVRIIPNHACVVSNMVNHVYLMRGEELKSKETVAARGCVT